MRLPADALRRFYCPDARNAELCYRQVKCLRVRKLQEGHERNAFNSYLRQIERYYLGRGPDAVLGKLNFTKNTLPERLHISPEINQCRASPTFCTVSNSILFIKSARNRGTLETRTATSFQSTALACWVFCSVIHVSAYLVRYFKWILSPLLFKLSCLNFSDK